AGARRADPWSIAESACPSSRGLTKFDRRSLGHLCRKHFQNMAVGVAEVKSASAMAVVDAHIVERGRSAARSDPLPPHPLEDWIELRLIDFEGVMVALETTIIIEVERKRIVDPERRKMGDRTLVAQPQNTSEKPGRGFLVVSGNDGMVENN